MKGKTLLGSIYLALAALIFSTMEVVLKLPAVSGSFHPMQITVERFLVGGLCLLPLSLRTLKKRGITLTGQDFKTFALTGFLCVPLAMVFYQLSITHGQANVVAVLFSINPIFVTVLAYLLLREKIYWCHVLALVLEAVGLDIFCDVPFLQGISLETLPYFLFLAVVNTAGGYVFHMLAVETTSATYGSLAFFFKPILAPPIALAVLHEAITLPMAVGILFFLAGSLASIVPEARRSKSIPPAHST
ncbi:MAG: DMT family transporter [Evtepia sp.]|uniref:DMT family transporter n=1 Tax=Evtepia sp. TaxID=2773933 RepID=UPI002A75DFDD|nr:DMT family transporter [Evtepia sp.]MDY3014725.1 DMT family transporter [Evtepia sp.]